MSVRVLMVLILALGCGLAWVARRAQIQRDAVRAIERADGQVWYGWQFKDGKWVVDGSPRGPKWLVNLIGVDCLNKVTMVHFFPNAAADAELAQLGNLDGINTLAIDLTNMSDAGLEHLGRLTSLRWLTIAARPPRNMDSLLGRLNMLGRLQGLNLDGSDVTDAGLRRLERLSGLELLGLSRTGVTDAGLAHLRGLKSLQYLDLSGTQVSDEGLTALDRLGSLKTLSLKGSKVSVNGAAAIQDAIPSVSVSR